MALRRRAAALRVFAGPTGADTVPSTLGAARISCSTLRHSAATRCSRWGSEGLYDRAPLTWPQAAALCDAMPWLGALAWGSEDLHDRALSHVAAGSDNIPSTLGADHRASRLHLRPLALRGQNAALGALRLLPGFLGTPSRRAMLGHPTALDDAWGGRLSGRSANTQKHRKSRFPGLVLGTHPLTMSHFGPPDSIRRCVGRPLLRRLARKSVLLSRGEAFFFCPKGFCQAPEMPSGRQTTQKPRKSRFPGPVDPGDPLTMSHFGPPDSIRRRVGRPPFGTPGPRLFRKSVLLSRGEAVFARNASARLQKCPQDHRPRRNPENRDFQASSWDPLTMSHLGPPDSIRRRVGRPPFGTPGPRLLRKTALLSRKRFCQAPKMPSGPQTTQKPRKSRFRGLVLGTPSR